MPEIDIHIGGRVFQVACQEGEEHFVQSAAALLDNEAQALAEALGRVPEARMLLLAGLMQADKTAGLEEELRLAEKRLTELEQAASAPAPVPLHTHEPEQVAVRVEVPVIPEEVVAAFADIADRTEAVAGALETAVG